MATRRRKAPGSEAAPAAEEPSKYVPEVRRMPLADLAPAPYNPRRISDSALRGLQNSLERFGLVQPIIWNRRTGQVVGGHQRVRALQASGADEAQVVIVDLEETDEKALNIALNSPHISGEWTEDLEPLLDDLRDLVPEMFDDLRLDALAEDVRRLAEEAAEEAEGGASIATDEDEREIRRLADDFGVPPFSVFETRQGYWQERKRAWIAAGVRGQSGRDDELTFKPRLRTEQGQALWKSKTPEGGRNTSVFDPVLTEILVEWFCPKEGLVIDPFAGGVTRAAVSAALGRNYLGTELRPEQIVANRSLLDDFDPPFERLGEVRYIEGDAAQAPEEIPPADFLLACPPYWNLETYSDDARDLSNMGWDAFAAQYEAILARWFSALRDDRFGAIVIGDVRNSRGELMPFREATIRGAQAGGAHLYNTAVLVTAVSTAALRARRAFEGTRKLVRVHQDVLIFLKGDAKKATAALGPPRLARFDDEEDEGPAPDAAEAPEAAPGAPGAPASAVRRGNFRPIAQRMDDWTIPIPEYTPEHYAEFTAQIAPVEERDGWLLKRCDRIALGPLTGGKVLQCLTLVHENLDRIRREFPGGLITASGLPSPQTAIVAGVARYFGLPCTSVVYRYRDGLRDVNRINVSLAQRWGSTIYGVGNSQLTGSETDAKYLAKKLGAYQIKFGMNGDTVLEPVARQVQNIPPEVETIVVVSGSGLSALGIRLGLARYPNNVKRLVAVTFAGQVHANEKAWYAPRPAAQKWGGVFEVVKAPRPYQQLYDATGDRELDLTYESKAWEWMLRNVPDDRRGRTLFWVVGRRCYDERAITKIDWHTSEREADLRRRKEKEAARSRA